MQLNSIKFALSSLGIISSFIVVSVLTEQRFKNLYGGKRFTYTCTMNCIYFFIVVISAIIAKAFKKQKTRTDLLSKDLM